jgi:glycosyltransferase involved in cell wall biosynthesis
MTRRPLTSIVIPAYGHEKFIDETLDSVLGQTHRELEVLVVDDHSPDRMMERVWRRAQHDSRVRPMLNPARGVTSAIRWGIEHSQGDFVNVMCADDVLHPRILELQLEAFSRAEENVGLVYNRQINVDVTGTRVLAVYGGAMSPKYGASRQTLRTFLVEGVWGLLVPPQSFMVRRSVYDRVGSWTIDACGDFELLLRIALSYEFAFVPEVLAKYRVHGSSVTLGLSRSKGLEDPLRAALGNFFKRKDFPAELEELRAQSMAGMLTLVAGWYYNQGHLADARRCSREAIALQPSLRSDPRHRVIERFGWMPAPIFRGLRDLYRAARGGEQAEPAPAELQALNWTTPRPDDRDAMAGGGRFLDPAVSGPAS